MSDGVVGRVYQFTFIRVKEIDNDNPLKNRKSSENLIRDSVSNCTLDAAAMEVRVEMLHRQFIQAVDQPEQQESYNHWRSLLQSRLSSTGIRGSSGAGSSIR